ncbi:mate efflux family protein [Venturia nashicola]|nr:mate efflux family protein [Venturia nashicola]
MATKDTPHVKTPITASITDQSNYGTWPNSEPGPYEVSPPSELSILVASSSPLVIGTILQFSQVAIALLFVGRLGKDELAATSLACLTANVTGWSVFQGLSSALDTLCPQAFGAGLKKVVGLHVQRMAGLLICVSLCVGCFWYNSFSFQRLLIPNDDICRLSRDFLRILLLGCPGYACFECGKRLLQAQGHFSAGLYTMLFCIPIHIFLTWFSVLHLGFGMKGAAISMAIIHNLLPFGLVIYSKIFTSGECWPRITRHTFQNWMAMIKLAIPSLLMLEVECIGFEILTLLAGQMGTAELCAQTLLVTFCGFIYKIPYSLAIAASTQISERIGEGSHQKAKETAKLVVLLAASFGSVLVVILLVFRNKIPYLFTNDPSVIVLMFSVVPMIAIFQLVDAIVGVTNGIIRGIGKQYVGAWIQTLGYYVVGLPFSVFAAFGLGWKLNGLWAGISVAMLLICFLEGMYMYFLDWSELVEDAKERNDAERDA